ncbi:MFS transporter [Streptomyces sp. Qhu-G9]|uniref:MFS transporter n=1 Tax=Streptomyces sp. Qhu-G9 TaxID=3452799 RepID=UPI0022ABEE53|nr:MFS transporter [Streptomyces aurantiacus]WAU82673.1 MFS transporter [Streptomyces aurantiacus]
MGWLTAAELLPSLLLPIPGGAWADRQTNRRRAMIVADIGRFAAIASVALAYACGALTMTHLYAAAFAVGVLTVRFRVCNHHVYASVVAADRYVDGNALLTGSRSVAAVAGPGGGGALVQALSAPITLLMDAITYLVSAMCLGRIRAQEAPPAPRGEGGLADGLRWVTANRTPALLLAGVAMLSLCQTLTTTLFVLYGTTELGLTPAAIGTVFAVFGVGGLAGAYAAPRVVRRIGIGPAPLVIGALAAAHLGAGCGVAVLDISANSYLIAVIPPTLRSRVMGVVQTANFGVRPTGAVLAGTLGTVLGLRPTLWIGTAFAVLSVLWVAASGLPRIRKLPENATQHREGQEEAGGLTLWPHSSQRVPGVAPGRAGAGRGEAAAGAGAAAGEDKPLLPREVDDKLVPAWMNTVLQQTRDVRSGTYQWHVALSVMTTPFVSVARALGV